MRVNATEIADVFEVTITTINRWIKNEEFPYFDKETQGKSFSTKDCINWFAIREIRKKVGDSEQGIFTLEAERARLAHHQANNEALKERQNSGDLISSDDVKKEWGDAIIAMRARMLALPSKLSKVAINAETVKEIERDAESLIYEALNELNIYAESSNTSEGSSGTSEAPTEVDSESVGGQTPEVECGSEQRTGSVEH